MTPRPPAEHDTPPTMASPGRTELPSAAARTADDAERRFGLRAFTVARAAALPAALAVGLLTEQDVSAGYWALLAAAAAGELAVAARRARGRASSLPLLPALLAASVAAGLAIHWSGGAHSDVRLLLLVLLPAVALWATPRVTAGVAGGALVAYLAAAAPELDQEPARTTAAVFAVALALSAIVAVVAARAREQTMARLRELLGERAALLTAVLESEAADRRAVGRSLHEGTLQSLLYARQELEGDDPEDRARAAAALDASMASLRDLVVSLHPVALDHGGLTAALRQIAGQGARDGGFAASVVVAREAEGVRDEELVTVAHEVVRNAVDHARAEHVEVAVTRSATALELVVRDDGQGFDPRAVALTEGVGLAACRERVEAAGGRFVVESGRGRGTVVRATLPAPAGT